MYDLTSAPSRTNLGNSSTTVVDFRSSLALLKYYNKCYSVCECLCEYVAAIHCLRAATVCEKTCQRKPKWNERDTLELTHPPPKKSSVREREGRAIGRKVSRNKASTTTVQCSSVAPRGVPEGQAIHSSCQVVANPRKS